MDINQFSNDLVVHGTAQVHDDDLKPDWSKKCDVCNATPIVPFTGLCGPCTFGEAETEGGNW